MERSLSIEEIEFPEEELPEGFEFPEPPEDITDKSFRSIWAVGIRATYFLQLWESVDEDRELVPGEPPDTDFGFVQSMYAAHITLIKLLGRDDVDDLKEDFSRVDRETLREVRGNIGYVATFFGIEIEYPDIQEP